MISLVQEEILVWERVFDGTLIILFRASNCEEEKINS